jgi:membrane fusion protein (multidrug efflux system)
MKKRMLLMLAIVIGVIAILGLLKYKQINSAIAQQKHFQPPPETVTSVVAGQDTWNTRLKAIGTVVAVNGVTVSADLPGVVEQIAFQSGQHVRKGELLVRLDAKQERAQLVAADAQRDLANVELARAKGMLESKIIAQAVYDSLAAQAKQAEARVGEIRATIQRKTILAPFDGVLGIRQINLGQYLAGGAPIVTLQSLHPVYVRFTVPQQEMGALRVGTNVNVTSDAMGGATETGRITAVESLINEATRNVDVQAIFDNRSQRLRPGMFVEAQLTQGAKQTVVMLPTSAIAYAPFGDSVFIIEDVKSPDGTKTYKGVRQQFVKLGGSRGDQVAVVTGVKPGEEIVTSGVFKLRPGAAVVVNNSVQPANSSNPNPADS